MVGPIFRSCWPTRNKLSGIFLCLLIICGFHIVPSYPTYLLVPLHLPSALEPPPKTKPNLKEKPKLYKTKNQDKNKIKNNKKKNLALEAVVWPGESFYPLVHISLLVSVLCYESLVWSKASGFCYTTSNRMSLGLLLDILRYPSVSWRS